MSTNLDPNPPAVAGGIGAALRRVDGPLKVTGGARYASDMPVGNPAFAYFHTSAIALGTVLEIDEREARALPGVIDILTWKSVEGQLNAIKTFSRGGPGSTSIRMLQSPEIRHDGEIVAVILAETYEAARDASHRLIVRYEDRDPVVTFGDEGLVPEDATKADPRFKNAKVGDAEQAFDAAEFKVDQKFATPIQHHNPIELFTTTAFYVHEAIPGHHFESSLGAQESAVQVGIDHGLPVGKSEVFKRHSRRIDTGVVEQHIQSAKGLLRLGKQGVDRFGIGDVASNRQGAVGLPSAGCVFKQFKPTPGQHHAVAFAQQSQSDGFANAAAGAGDEGGFVDGIHVTSALFLTPRNSCIRSSK